ncbi:uncharacterized protein LOC142764753 isoform X1 [Rhipicephalus microplus]|uniref:uncharacterized protein LOC142764753 isoform X1 n=1 Tax=Rhipicephalus microplus TaxID=6941 RepID=UPI003F6AE352
MSTRCLLCWPFWQFRRLYRKRRPRRLSSSLFLRASATTLTDDVFDFTVHLYSALQGSRRHRTGKARTKPCLYCYGSDPTWHPAATKRGSAGGATAEAQGTALVRASARPASTAPL